MIIKEGVGSLDINELQQACRDRGMRAMGLSPARLRSQLEQWLDLHINHNIPISLLLFSRSLYLPENLPAEDIIKSTISKLPKSIENATMAKIAEMSGGKVDNTVKLELLKQEENQIKQEKIESLIFEEESKPVSSSIPAAKPTVEPIVKTLDLSKQLDAEILADKVKSLAQEKLETHDIIKPTDIKELNLVLENLPSSEKNFISDEIKELKKDVDEYNEDVKEVEQLTSIESTSKLTETKSAKILSKRVQKLISDMDSIMADLEKDNEPKLTNMISIEELMKRIQQIRGGQIDETKDKKLLELLRSLDNDHDGKIDDLNEILKVT